MTASKMTFQERKRKQWLNYDVTVCSVSLESFGWKKEVTELDTRLQPSWYLARIIELWGFLFFLIWVATWNHCWLEFSDSSSILYHKVYYLVCLPEKEETWPWLLSERVVWTHTLYLNSYGSLNHISGGWKCAPEGQWSQIQKKMRHEEMQW